MKVLKITLHRVYEIPWEMAYEKAKEFWEREPENVEVELQAEEMAKDYFSEESGLYDTEDFVSSTCEIIEV